METALNFWYCTATNPGNKKTIIAEFVQAVLQKLGVNLPYLWNSGPRLGIVNQTPTNRLEYWVLSHSLQAESVDFRSKSWSVLIEGQAVTISSNSREKGLLKSVVCCLLRLCLLPSRPILGSDVINLQILSKISTANSEYWWCRSNQQLLMSTFRYWLHSNLNLRKCILKLLRM